MGISREIWSQRFPLVAEECVDPKLDMPQHCNFNRSVVSDGMFRSSVPPTWSHFPQYWSHSACLRKNSKLDDSDLLNSIWKESMNSHGDSCTLVSMMIFRGFLFLQNLFWSFIFFVYYTFTFFVSRCRTDMPIFLSPEHRSVLNMI